MLDVEKLKNRFLEYGKEDFIQPTVEQAAHFADYLLQNADNHMLDDLSSFAGGAEPAFKYKGVSVVDINRKERGGIFMAYMTMLMLVKNKTLTPEQYLKMDLRPVELKY